MHSEGKKQAAAIRHAAEGRRENLYLLHQTVRLLLDEQQSDTAKLQKLHTLAATDLLPDHDLDALREFDAALHDMADEVAGFVGQAYLDELVKYLSLRFGVDIALVGLLDDSGENIRTVAVAENGALAANFTYALSGTPCAEVIQENFCIYQDDVQKLFPDDRWFIENKVRGYAGIRLHDAAGRVIGVLSSVSLQPLRNVPGIESLFKLAASRANAELDRMHQAAAAEASELRYTLTESGIADGLWDMDLTTGAVYYSPRVGELLGVSVDALSTDAEVFWKRIHRDDVVAVRRAFAGHLDKGSPFDVQYRIRHADGSYRWFRARGQTVRGDNGPQRFTGALTDITEGKRHQLLLKAENAWLAKFAAGAPLDELLRTIGETGAYLLEDVELQLWLLEEDAAAPRVFSAHAATDLDHDKVRALLGERNDAARMLAAQDPDWPDCSAVARFDRAWLVPVRAEGVAQRAMLVMFYPAGFLQQAYERQIAETATRLVRLALDNLRNAADLARQRLLFENLFRSAPEAMVILDCDDCVLDVNPQFTAMFQYDRGEVLGCRLNDLVVPLEFAHEAVGLSGTVLRGGNVVHESFRRCKDGTLLPVSILGAPVTVSGTAAAYFAIYRDQSSLHEAAQRLEHQARHDILTGLPNRYEFERRLQQAMALSADGQGSTGVIYFDLDQFKVVNDTVGHTHGDSLLQELTRRLRPLVRNPHQLARLGGDEFAVLLVNAGQADCERLAQQIRDELDVAPFQIDERTFTVTASFGIVAVPARSPQQPHEILSLADSACFLAKDRGRNRIQVHDPNDTGMTQRREEMDWISRLNEALLENRFVLHHQRIEPVNEPPAGMPQHSEILLRMIDGEGNDIPPAVFIPPAERFNLMPRVDRWVLAAVFARFGRYSMAEQEGQLVAVNISGNTLSDEGLTDFIFRLFEQHAVRPQSLCFEITETSAIANFDDALRFIEAARGLGCRVALDDFGSGLSSFRYLKEIAPDYLKIDGSFVREIRHSRTDFSMVEAINRVGKSIGIRTVAEFVEDADTLRALRYIGVDLAQGYGLHRPEPWLP